MRKIIYALLCLLLLLSCQHRPDKTDLRHYFPSKARLQEGMVNKYYYHYKSFDGFTESTNILYEQMQISEADKIQLVKYNAGFQPVLEQMISFDPLHMQIEQMQQFARKDTVQIETEKASYLSLKNKDFNYSYSYEWLRGWQGHTSIKPLTQKDSSSNGINFIIQTDSLFERFHHPKKGDDTSHIYNRTLFASGIGLFDQQSVLPQGKAHLELIEQIPLDRFNEMKQHGLKRIAYIDPQRSFTEDPDFELCGEEDDIIDYYNTDPDSHHPYKDSLRMQLASSIDTNQLKSESGYLTFRFVMNCEGKRGRHICEETSLDFEPKRFDKAVRDYLLQRLIETKGWKPQPLRGEYRDAYAYVTFKLQDGEIIELLP